MASKIIDRQVMHSMMDGLTLDEARRVIAYLSAFVSAETFQKAFRLL
jgi:hypothetical protein